MLILISILLLLLLLPTSFNIIFEEPEEREIRGTSNQKRHIEPLSTALQSFDCCVIIPLFTITLYPAIFNQLSVILSHCPVSFGEI